jgi:hypothetical protein
VSAFVFVRYRNKRNVVVPAPNTLANANKSKPMKLSIVINILSHGIENVYFKN